MGSGVTLTMYPVLLELIASTFWRNVNVKLDCGGLIMFFNVAKLQSSKKPTTI